MEQSTETIPPDDKIRRLRGRIAKLGAELSEVQARGIPRRTRDETPALYRNEIETIYAAAPVGLCLVDADLRFLRINERLAEAYALPAAQPIGKTLREALPELAPRLEPLLRSVLESGRPVLNMKTESTVREHTDVVRRYLASYYPLKTSGGVTFGVTGIVQEILSETPLDERIRRVFEQSPIGIALVGKDFCLSMANSALCRMLDYSEAELKAKSFAELMHPDDLAADLVLSQQLVRHEIPFYKIENRLLKRGGEFIWGSLTACLVRNDTGEPQYGLGMIEDITERIRDEQKTRSLAAAIQQTAEMVIITDLDGRIQYCNPAFERTTGFLLEEIAGQETAVAFRDRLHGVVESGTFWSGHVTDKRKDGSSYDAAVTVSPIRDASGGVTSFVALIHDATKRHSLENQLRQAQRLESVGQLVGGMVHHFNDLLAVVNGYGDILLRQLKEGDPSKRQVAEIRKAGGRAAALTEQLLTFSRTQILKQQSLNLNQLLTGNQEMLQRLLGEDIEMQIRLAPGLGDVMADPEQARQILVNLATNAREAMPRGGKLTLETQEVEVDKGLAAGHPGIAPGPFVLLTVSDTGIGMDARTRERIFDPFFTTRAEGGGVGLGLSIIYGIVRQSGGWIAVSSEPGAGATFRIYLPRIPAVELASPLPAARELLQGTETILVVVPEEPVRSFCAQSLRSYGYRVLEVPDGLEALGLAAGFRGPIHLLVATVEMPGMNGPALTRELQALRPEIKVIYIGADSKDSATHNGLTETGDGYLMKPFAPDVLAGKVREVLGPAPPLADGSEDRETGEIGQD